MPRSTRRFLALVMILAGGAGLAAWPNLGLGVAEEQPPGIASDYFPARAFAAPGEGDELGAWYAGACAGALGQMGEPPLRAADRAVAAPTVFRIVVLPTWGEPLAVRAEADRDSAISCRRVKLDGEFNHGAIREDRRGPLPRDEWHRLAARFEASGFWAMPGRLHPDRVVADGVYWLIEAVDRGRYHAVFCHSPPAGPFRDLGRELLDRVEPPPAGRRTPALVAVAAAGVLALALGAAARRRRAQPRRTL